MTGTSRRRTPKGEGEGEGEQQQQQQEEEEEEEEEECKKKKKHDDHGGVCNIFHFLFLEVEHIFFQLCLRQRAGLCTGYFINFILYVTIDIYIYHTYNIKDWQSCCFSRSVT